MTHYTIIGGGRLARHFSEYFRLAGIPFKQWQRAVAGRQSKADLQQALAGSSHVLLLISDAEIQNFVGQHPQLADKTLIHCSGAHSFAGIAGVHPLMTFAKTLYPLAVYESMPMVWEVSAEPGWQFKQLFPDLKNPNYPIQAENKGLYHAYCVVAGNFSQMLWQMSRAGLQTQLGLPEKVLQNYLQQNLTNFFNEGAGALTGPIARGDTETIEANLDALADSPLAAIYRQFYRSFGTHHPATCSKERAA